MLSCVDGFLPINIAKIVQTSETQIYLKVSQRVQPIFAQANIYIFLQSMLFLEYYFFLNKVIWRLRIPQKYWAIFNSMYFLLLLSYSENIEVKRFISPQLMFFIYLRRNKRWFYGIYNRHAAPFVLMFLCLNQ